MENYILSQSLVSSLKLKGIYCYLNILKIPIHGNWNYRKTIFQEKYLVTIVKMIFLILYMDYSVI